MRGRGAERGATLAEILVAVAILASLVAVSAPAAAYLRNGGRAAAAAREVATTFASERWRAVTLSRTGGLQFEGSGAAWRWRPVEDGNGNGLRTAELRSGVDRARGEAVTLSRSVPGTRFGFPAGGPYPEAPPGRERLSEGDDPIRFGRSDLVSFSPDGSSSSGTLYVTDGSDALFAIVLFGPTARVRVWRWDGSAGRWTL